MKLIHFLPAVIQQRVLKCSDSDGFLLMILYHQLNKADQQISQKYYIAYNAVNGFSYMCLGEAVILLFAVKLGCSDGVAAVLGSMIHLGFLLLPLGKLMTARSGAAGSQANFWVLRNLAALIVAAAAPAAIWWGNIPASILLVTGSFLFYGFRAAGVVMSQPLIGEFCPAEEQGGFIFKSWCWFYASGLAALLLVSFVLRVNQSIWMLQAVIVTGTISGLISSGFIRKIRESGDIMISARKPLRQAVVKTFRNPDVIRQLFAGMSCNTVTIMTVPISMLALKRGFQVSDSSALLYSLIQFGSSIAICMLLSRTADRFGGKKVTAAGFYGLYLIPIFWLSVPENFCWYWLIIPFLLCPLGSVVVSVGMQQYFLKTVPKDQQIAASMVISVATGVISGVLGSLLSAGMLKAAAVINGETGTALMMYKKYFLGVLLIMPLLGIFLHLLRGESIVNLDGQNTPAE